MEFILTDDERTVHLPPFHLFRTPVLCLAALLALLASDSFASAETSDALIPPSGERARNFADRDNPEEVAAAATDFLDLLNFDIPMRWPKQLPKIFKKFKTNPDAER